MTRQIPRPGYDSGPCVMRCAHVRCEDARRVAGSICGACEEQIGFNRNYLTDLDHGKEVYVHYTCRQRQIQEAVKKIRRVGRQLQ